MKRPIDPNLENLSTEDFILSADNLSEDKEISFTEKPEKIVEENPDFIVKEAEEPAQEADYFASEHHKKQAEKGTLSQSYKELRVGDAIDAHKKSDAFDIVDKSDSGSSEHHHSQHHHSHHSSSSSHHHHSHHSGSSSQHHHAHHGSSSSHHHHSHSSHKKKMPIAAKIAIIILVILLLFIFAVVGTILFLEHKGENDMKNTDSNTNYEEVIEYKGKKYVYNNDIVSIAFMGVDKRDLGLEDNAIGTAGQADADILLTVDTATGKAKALAIPRDTMVDVDVYSQNNLFLRSEKMQLCLSYAYGDGKTTSAANVTTSMSRILYNVPINKYFALDLNGIAPINDAIGGVTVESLYDFKNADIKKGESVHLIGDLTETYVRTRDLDDIEASLNRTARQVQYIKAFAAQLAPAVAKDFSIVSRLYNTASSYSTTNLSLSNVTYLGTLLLSKGVTDFETYTLEGEMKKSDKKDKSNVVYAEFYPDEDKLMETVLDIFYKEAK